MNLLSLFKPIKAFVFDVDGVLTDGTLFLMPGGEMVRRMNIKDGYALQLAVKKGYEVIVISGGDSELVQARLNKLGIQKIHMQETNKASVLQSYITSLGLQPAEVLFMGDDMPDLEPMKLAGLPCSPADACTEVKAISKYISTLSGGQGAVRDVIEKVLRLNHHWMHDPSASSR